MLDRLHDRNGQTLSELCSGHHQPEIPARNRPRPVTAPGRCHRTGVSSRRWLKGTKGQASLRRRNSFTAASYPARPNADGTGFGQAVGSNRVLTMTT